MIGTYRFFLASLVVYSHINLPHWGIEGFKINQGVYAVFCFYIISGFFTALICDRFEDNMRGARNFYFDRLLRLMPVFWAIMSIAILITLIKPNIYPHQSPGDFFNLTDLIHAALQPISNVVAYFLGGDFAMGRWFIIPPVASLAIEIQFFFIFPFLRNLSIKNLSLLILPGVLWVLYASSLGGDFLESATYRHLLGTLPLFIVGFMFYLEIVKNIEHKWLRFDYISYAIGICYLIAAFAFRPEPIAWLEEAAIAFLTCPIFFRLSMKIKSSNIDHLLGYLAYGIFLAHIPIIKFFNLDVSYLSFLYAMILATLVALIVHYSIEKPVLKIRHNRSKKYIKNL